MNNVCICIACVYLFELYMNVTIVLLFVGIGRGRGAQGPGGCWGTRVCWGPPTPMYILYLTWIS